MSMCVNVCSLVCHYLTKYGFESPLQVLLMYRVSLVLGRVFSEDVFNRAGFPKVFHLAYIIFLATMNHIQAGRLIVAEEHQ